MDEATSALDYDQSNAFATTCALACWDTVFFITHRLSTIRHADRILMMHQGAVVEQEPR